MPVSLVWAHFNGLIGLLIILFPFILVQMALHREIQIFLLRLTRKPKLAIILFSVIFLPGVFIHELSHLLVARLTGVRTGRFSLIPRPLPNGQLQLGFVETSPSDWIRSSLIGAAPLIAGGGSVALLAILGLRLDSLWSLLLKGDWSAIWQALVLLPKLPLAWLWFYLVFVISSTMMPSRSDRHAWTPLVIVLVLLVMAASLAGAGPWMLDHMAPTLNSLLQALALIFGLSLLVHVLFLVPAASLNWVMMRITRRY